MLHDETGGGDSKVDLNRTGTPLVEIVSQPDLTQPEEARVIWRNCDCCCANWKCPIVRCRKEVLRCDANINLHLPQPDGSVAATPIVEVKNLNSIRGVENALRDEAERQYEEFRRTGETLKKGSKTTAGWDAVRSRTVVQRSKEEASDYRYFPDPDLVPVTLTASRRLNGCEPRWANCPQCSLPACRANIVCRPTMRKC